MVLDNSVDNQPSTFSKPGFVAQELLRKLWTKIIVSEAKRYKVPPRDAYKHKFGVQLRQPRQPRQLREY